jgi:hypothetical protein
LEELKTTKKRKLASSFIKIQMSLISLRGRLDLAGTGWKPPNIFELGFYGPSLAFQRNLLSKNLITHALKETFEPYFLPRDKMGK